MISAVASRYANALLDVVLQSPVKPAEVTAQIASVEALIAGNEDLRHVLETPAVPGSRKRAVLGDLAGPLGLSPLVRNFIFVIVDHRRIGTVAHDARVAVTNAAVSVVDAGQAFRRGECVFTRGHGA